MPDRGEIQIDLIKLAEGGRLLRVTEPQSGLSLERMWRAIINASVFGAASVWYFYFKPNVAAYFRELRDRYHL